MGLAIYKHRTPEEIEEYYNNIATGKIDNLCKTYKTQFTNKKIKFNKYLETIEDKDELKDQQILIHHNLKIIWEVMENEIKIEINNIYKEIWNKIDLEIK